MDPLRDWHRYIDRQSRPARRPSDERDTPALWRPWINADEDAEEEVAEAVRPEEVPDLAGVIGAEELSEALMPAVVEYVDPTLDDVLEPMREFAVPHLEPPGFDLSIPRLQVPAALLTLDPQATSVEGEAPAAEQPGLHRGAPADGARAGGENAPSPETREDGPLKSERYQELLAQLRSREGAQNGRARFRESREELVQRLVDPTLTLEETALLLGVCPQTVRRYTNRGHLRHFRTSGNQRRFRFSDVVEFLETRSAEIEADARAEREAEERRGKR
jgi:excisionase family DNA binding protein